MATLKDLCSKVPQSLLNEQTNYNLMQRKVASYEKRVRDLDMERAIFEQCKRERTKKRVRNSFSREEAGTCGDVIVTFRKGYTTQVCRAHRNSLS